MSTTRRFQIISNTMLVGWSELELGDAPMGVAFGRFLPSPGYSAIQPVVASANGGPLPSHLHLSVRDETGQTLLGSGGVHLIDCSAELGAEGLEVSVLGVPYPLYEEMFPQHVAAYEKQLPSDG